MATLQEAREEAYASVQLDLTLLHALEIWHPVFDEPLRLVMWPVVGPEMEKFECLHELKAKHDPGRIVDYYGIPFEISLPESSQQSEGKFGIKADAFNNFDEHLLEAALNPGIIEATYRQYIKGRELEGPASTWPGIIINSPKREGATISADGAILGWMNKPFGWLFLPTDYPGLVTGR